MYRQSGFTLIELLLVLAIIGIVSAIAIPTLLGQRSRARDKSSIANADSIIGELVAGYDRAKEAGNTLQDVPDFTAKVIGVAASPLVPQCFTTGNPWAITTAGYAAVTAESSNTGTDTAAAAISSTLGQVHLGFLPPGTSSSGCIAAAVYLKATYPNSAGTGTHVYLKTAGIG
jgi:type IV pilus assembly protein PilA